MWDEIMRKQIKTYEDYLAGLKDGLERDLVRKMIAGKEANLAAYSKR